MKQGFAGRLFLFHDFDGVHYDYNLIPGAYSFLAQSKILAIRMICPDMLRELGEDELIRIGKESYARTGDGLLSFVELAATKYGIEREWFQAELHTSYNRINFERTTRDHSHIFNPCAKTNALLQRLSDSGFRHGLLTQSCLNDWAEPALERLERAHFFPAKARVGFFEGGCVCREHDPAPFKVMLDRMEAEPARVIVIDDRKENLAMAKKLDARFLTVHICHDRPDAVLEDCVDYQFPVLSNALSVINKHHNAPRLGDKPNARPELHV